jgi:hypothetical protein
MAWLDTCRIDAGKQVAHLKDRGKSTAEAIRILSQDSGIPESTLNNWIYARKRSRPFEISDFVFDEMFADLRAKDSEQWGRFNDSVKVHALHVMMWLWLDTEHVLNWYRAAFDYYGRSARITDGWRAGYVRCDCVKCMGKVHHFGQLHNPGEDYNYASELMRVLSKQGYVNFNAIALQD